MSHCHLLLDYVSCDEEQDSRDKFFLMIQDDSLSLAEKVLFCSLNQTLEVTHYYME